MLSDDTIEITELPIKTWTQSYKESVLEPMLESNDKKPALIRWEFKFSFSRFAIFLAVHKATQPTVPF